MKTIIATAITAIMLTTTTTCFANNNTKVIPGHRDNGVACTVYHPTDRMHDMLRRVEATHRCNCHTCKDLRRMHDDPRRAANVEDTKRCSCPTCKDIRHNERVIREAKMAYNAPKPTPVLVAPNRTGDKVVNGRR